MKEQIKNLIFENKNLEKQHIEVSENSTDVTFNISENENIQKASLQCDIDTNKNSLIARTIIVEKDYLRQGIGTELFIKAIEYAREHNLKFITDYGISEDADKLIQSLISKGYNFVKNPQSIEKQGNKGKRIVTFDGSPVYSLRD